MAGAIWSCPVEQMRAFPMETFTRFCENHGLLQITDRPQWYTVRGGSATYIEKLKSRALSEGRRIRWLAQHEVMQVRPEESSHSAKDSSATGLRHRVSVGGMHQQDTLIPSPFSETYDAAVLACHSDQSARLLHDTPIALAQIAGQVRYQKNHAFLHTDRRLMPQRTRAWAAWNYMHDTGTNTQENSVSVTYWMNRLQPLPCATPVLVTLNPTRAPDPRLVINEMHYDHPIFDGPAIHAQQRLPAHQGEGSIWLAGAWTRYGFHEDGFQSGVNAASMIKQRFADTPTGHDYAQAA